jgi:hypothetical protein
LIIHITLPPVRRIDDVVCNMGWGGRVEGGSDHFVSSELFGDELSNVVANWERR